MIQSTRVNRKTLILHLALIILLSIYGVKALFHPGFFTSLDGWHNIARLYHFHNTLTEGQLLPRWSADLASGYGYPLFVFSYHMPWIIAEPFMMAGLDVFVVMKIVFFIGFIGSGIVLYVWLRDLSFHPAASVTAAIVYLWTPYRFAKILVGASVGEATVFLFLPLLFWGISRLEAGKRYVVIGAIGLTGMILSHMMILPMLIVSIGLFSIYFWRRTKMKTLFIQRYILMMLLGIGMAAYYLIPLLAYSGSIKATTMQGGFKSLYGQHFVTFKQLLYSKWGFGPVINSAKDGEISFQVGIAQWIGVAACFVLVIVFWIRKKNSGYDGLAIILLLSFTSSLFFMLDISKPLWDIVERSFTIDFPWRFLSITTFIGAVLCGLAVHLTGKYKYITLLVILSAAVYTNRNHLNVNQYTDIPLSLYIDSETTTNTYAEYLPVWSNVDINKKPAQLIDPQEGVTIDPVWRNSRMVQFRASTTVPVTLTLNYLDFPGQTVYLNDEPIRHDRTGDGRITFPVSPGMHQVRVVYEQSRLMKISNSISLASIAVLLYYCWFTGKIASRKK